ncbi:cytochrome P450 [Mycena rebaudengoi]|nr:cytochrome P450 [Mycena rebaudengoi]
MDNSSLLVYGLLTVVGIAYIRKLFYDSKLSAIPIVGSSSFFASYVDAYSYLRHAPERIQQGYEQYPEGVFRVARLFHWEFIACGHKLVTEVGAAPDNVLSFHGGVEERIQTPFTMGRSIQKNSYHQATIRTSLTRNLHRCFPDVRDEIVCAFDDVLSLQGTEWKTVPVLQVTMAVVARVSNRLFVGLPLCRDPPYLRNSVQYTLDVMRSAQRIALFPKLLRPIVGPLIANRKESMRVAMKFLGPLVEERIQKENQLGPNWPGKPNDLISWLLDHAEGEDRATTEIVQRILVTNMAAIHTSSMAFTHAIFDLTRYPSHIAPMREEAERIIKQQGWSKAALNSMVLIDSFIRESQRMNGNGPVAMSRKVVDPNGFRFSDGTVIPYGSYVMVASRPAHYDALNYDDPAVFDGFRFAKMREERDHESSTDIFKRHMVSTGTDHLVFGHGKHACPGRFFAATELKAMLAHLILNYDMKAEIDGVRPPNQSFGLVISPNPKGRVSLRKRE